MPNPVFLDVLSELGKGLMVVAPTGTAFWWIVKLSMRAELEKFKNNFIKEINGTYRRSEVCDLKMEAIVQKLEEIKDNSERFHLSQGDYLKNKLFEMATQLNLNLEEAKLENEI